MKVIKVMKWSMLVMFFCAIVWGKEIPAPSAARLTPAVVAVKQALPCVVSIGTNEKILQINDPFELFFNAYFNSKRYVKEAVTYSPLGSGVIVDSNGLVLTNTHVVRRAAQIEVRTWDGTSYQAHVVGYDVPNDLCVLQLEGDFNEKKQLPVAAFARRNDLLLGETVIAIGNPFGLEHSVSQGTLAAFNRSFEEDGFTFTDILQINASINPGNSGGPLVNLDGHLIAINLAIREDAQGIGFAIPLSRIEDFLTYWLKPSHFENAFMGMDPGALVSESEDADGVVISEIVPDSPLAKAGITNQSIITHVNGNAVHRGIDFSKRVWKLKKGDEVKLTTSDGKVHVVKLVEMPSKMLLETRLGIKVVDLSKAVRANMGLSDDFKGVMITDVLENEIFSTQDAQWRQIIKRGDIIVSFDTTEITNEKDLANVLAACKSGESHRMGFLSRSPRHHSYIPMVINPLHLN